jgi:TPR repeat protein
VQRDLLLAKSLSCFEHAAKQGVSSAMFYLGMIHLEGRFVPGDVKLAFDYFVEGASRNNAYCYYELSRIYGNEDGPITKLQDE